MLKENFKLIYLLCLIILSCSTQEIKQINFEYLPTPFNHDDEKVLQKNTGSYISNGIRIFNPAYNLSSFGKSYIVENYIDSDENNRKVDSFACMIGDSFNKKYDLFHITMYCKSKYTNVNYIKTHPETINEESDNDLIIQYYWNKIDENNIQFSKTHFHNFKNENGFNYCESNSH